MTEFEVKQRVADGKFMKKEIDAIKEKEPGKAFEILMGAQSGDGTDDITITLPSHQSEGLTENQSAG